MNNQDLDPPYPQLLKHRQEVLSNLVRCLGISESGEETRRLIRIALGCGVLSIMSGTAFFVGALLLVIDMFSPDSEWLPSLTVVILTITLGIAISVGFGAHYLTQAFTRMLHLDYAEHLLSELIANGQVVEGKVTSVKTTSDAKHEVEYLFISPEDNDTVRGTYITSIHKKYSSHHKIRVLFLTHYIHIPL
jgi:hypothetical protein